MTNPKLQEEMNKRLREVKDPNNIAFISYLGQNEIKALEAFLQSEISKALEEQMKEVMKCWPKHRVITNTFSALNKAAIKLNQREDYCLDKFKNNLNKAGLI